MDASTSAVAVLLALLLFTTFIKSLTVLSIARYGLGLVGFEFGAVCLVVAAGFAWVACPPELTAIGFPDALFSRSQQVQPQAVSQALLPFMQRRIDPTIDKHLVESVGKDQKVTGQAAAQPNSASLREVVPAYVLSELKDAFQMGCIILIPLVMVDLLVSHVLALIGVQNIAAAAVALPLKLILFLVAGGWGLLGKKLLGID